MVAWLCKVCKLDTGMQKSKLHPKLQMQQMLQLDLLLRPANLTSLLPTGHGAPSQVNFLGQNSSPEQAPNKNLQIKNQKQFWHKILAQPSQRVISPT